MARTNHTLPTDFSTQLKSRAIMTERYTQYFLSMRSTSQMVLLMMSMLMLIARNQCQTTFSKTAVEGVSRNINILCDLDRQFYPLYWKINEYIYDQYNVPEIFTVVGHELSFGHQ